MKRLTTLFPPALARLAFWRKPAAADVEQPDSVPEDAPAGRDAPSEAPVDARPGWRARLRQAFRRQPADETEATAAPALDEPGVITTRPTDEADAPAAPRPGLLARLAGRLRRQTPAASADAATDAAPDGSRRLRDEAHDEASEPPPSRLGGLRAIVSRKRVWIPTASAMLLAVVGTLGVLLWQSAQEKAALQEKLQAAEKELERAGPAAGIAPPTAAAQRPAAEPLVAAAVASPSALQIAGGDCDISDAATAALRLKDCIDAFNQESGGSRPSRPQQAPR